MKTTPKVRFAHNRGMKSVLALLLAAPLLAAQTSPIPALQSESARRPLDSPGWREKAWGAYLAARLHTDDLNRILADQFLPAAALRDAAYQSDEYAYLTVLFDAAIESGIRVPAAALEPFQERWAEPVLILLARDPESSPALLRLRTDEARPLAALVRRSARRDPDHAPARRGRPHVKRIRRQHRWRDLRRRHHPISEGLSARHPLRIGRQRTA
jgi:hypothetical protein